MYNNLKVTKHQDLANPYDDDEKVGIEASEKDPPPRARADLNGVREVAGVRDLLRAWMGSTSEPTGDDVETVEAFLGDLVDEDDLEAVLWLIRGAIQFT